MTDAILETAGEIYQYVGDEIVVSWTEEKGLAHNNCIRCFEKISTAIHLAENDYRAKFGFVPDFKAGIHLGEVTTQEMFSMPLPESRRYVINTIAGY